MSETWPCRHWYVGMPTSRCAECTPSILDGMEALVRKYERKASTETARYVRASEVVADLRTLAKGA